MTRQGLHQGLERRETVAMTARAPVLEAIDHLKAITEIGQLQRRRRLPLRVDPLCNSQIRGLDRDMVALHEFLSWAGESIRGTAASAAMRLGSFQLARGKWQV